MSDTHDQGAINASSVILNKIRSEDEKFKQIFTTRFHRSGFTGWPKADAIFKDYFEEDGPQIGQNRAKSGKTGQTGCVLRSCFLFAQNPRANAVFS